MIKSRKIRWTEYIARIGEKRNAYRCSVGKPEEKRPLEKPRRRREDNIKMDFREKFYAVLWTGVICLRMEVVGGVL
jgi:hypothetical protein